MAAAAITCGIFLLGLFLGLVVEGKRIASIQEEERMQNLDFSSLQVQYQFIDQLSKPDNCAAVEQTLNTNLKSLEKSRVQLDEYSQQSTFNTNEYELLRREYMLAQLRYWMFSRQTQEVCRRDQLDILYFFHTTEICPECDGQSFVLDYMKKIFQDDLLIFSVDGTLGSEPMISILTQTYNVTQYPTIVINGEKIEGFIESENLQVSLCSTYQDQKPACA